jgi:hypothetical protein
MTPKDKAENLIEKMMLYSVEKQTLESGYFKYNVSYKIKDIHAIQCALIAVDEILNIKSVYHDIDLSDYWADVKQAISSL